jgi:hypothetical protein
VVAMQDDADRDGHKLHRAIADARPRPRCHIGRVDAAQPQLPSGRAEREQQLVTSRGVSSCIALFVLLLCMLPSCRVAYAR